MLGFETKEIEKQIKTQLYEDMIFDGVIRREMDEAEVQ